MGEMSPMELTLHDILRCRQEVQHQLPLPLPGAAGGLPPSIQPEHNTGDWTRVLLQTDRLAAFVSSSPTPIFILA